MGLALRVYKEYVGTPGFCSAYLYTHPHHGGVAGHGEYREEVHLAEKVTP